MTIINTAKSRKNHWDQLSRIPVRDPEISLKAKGLLWFCMSHADGWQFHITQLETVLKEKETALQSAFNELEKSGYVIRWQPRSQKGKFNTWQFIISDDKEEIECIKKELNSDPDFQRSFTERHFRPPAHNEYEPEGGFPGPDNGVAVSPEDIHIHQERAKERNIIITSSSSLSPSPDEAPLKEKEKDSNQSDDLITYNKHNQQVRTSLSDIYRRLCNTNFSTDEIRQAIQKTRFSTAVIDDVYAYIVGIIRTDRQQTARNQEKKSRYVPENAGITDPELIKEELKKAKTFDIKKLMES